MLVSTTLRNVAAALVLLAAGAAAGLAYGSGESMIRVPHGPLSSFNWVALPEFGETVPLGRGRVLREGTQVAILSLGARLSAALAGAELLAAEGVSVTVADARFAKPIDRDLVLRLAREHAALIPEHMRPRHPLTEPTAMAPVKRRPGRPRKEHSASTTG